MTEWEINFGIIPGILLGFRQYVEENETTNVLYFGCFDIALTIFND